MNLQSSRLALLLLTFSISLSEATECKCTPSDPCWPTESAWDKLNLTISGRLIRTTLPASVCYPSEPDYNRTACDALIPEWKTSEFHSEDPVSIPSPNYANNSCNPIYANGTNLYGDAEAGERGCHIGKYPPYVVNATKASHVQAAVKFAHEHNLRLNVKNTGHSSFRAVAYGALSIWTHHMKSFTFHKTFTPSSCPSTTDNATSRMAATFGAGVQGADANPQVLNHSAIVVTGTNKDVGLLGWSSGGGHGFFTGSYGMGADNILEATVVTLTGDVVVANECQNAELFWALRGGGGGTYGIVTEVTVRAFPEPSTNMIAFGVTQRNGTSVEDWWRLVAQWHATLPALKDSGIQGYYVMSGPTAGEMGNLQLTGTLFLHGAPNGTAQQAWAPAKKVLDQGKAVADSWATFQHFKSWSEFYNIIPATGSAGGGGSARSSRLLTRDALSKNVETLAEKLAIAGPQAKPAKGGVSNFMVSASIAASPKPVNSSLNPAWRDTVVHYIVSISWDDSLPDEQAKKVQDDIANCRGLALRQLAPDSGAYWNEADTEEPDWQWSFYGPNYAKLQAIKGKYDPDTLLWCDKCVGSEAWFEQQDGRLCRNS